MADVTLNQILYKSILMQYEWAEQQDWSNISKEEKQKICDRKGVEIYKELKEKYLMK